MVTIFLEEYDTYTVHVNDSNNKKSKDKFKALQEALLSLKPLNRIVVIWKDALNFQLSDLISVTNYNKKELNAELIFIASKSMYVVFDALLL